MMEHAAGSGDFIRQYLWGIFSPPVEMLRLTRGFVGETWRELAPLRSAWKCTGEAWSRRIRNLREYRVVSFAVFTIISEIVTLWIFALGVRPSENSHVPPDLVELPRLVAAYTTGPVIVVAVALAVRLSWRTIAARATGVFKWAALATFASTQWRYGWITELARYVLDLVPDEDRDRVLGAIDYWGPVLAVWPAVGIAGMTAIGVAARLRVLARHLDGGGIAGDSWMAEWAQGEPIPTIRDSIRGNSGVAPTPHRTDEGMEDVPNEATSSVRIAARGSFVGVPCALCVDGESSPKGEHVIPAAIYRLFKAEGGAPFTITVGGRPVATRAGAAEYEDLPPFQLPCCKSCNELLRARFEDPAIDLVKELVLGKMPAEELTAGESGALALWWIKTTFLLEHPQTESAIGISRSGPRWVNAPRGFWDWLVDGRDPPAPVSLWLMRHPRALLERPTSTEYALPRTTINERDQTLSTLVSRLGLGALSVQLAFHPGWVPVHPLEAAGCCTRLWPEDDRAATVRDLTVASDEERDVWNGTWGTAMRLILKSGRDPLADPIVVDRVPQMSDLPEGVVGLAWMAD